MHNKKSVTFKCRTGLPDMLLVDGAFDQSLATSCPLFGLKSTACWTEHVVAAINTSYPIPQQLISPNIYIDRIKLVYGILIA
jgi:hypothetical protein